MSKVKFSVFSDLHLGRGMRKDCEEFWYEGGDRRLDAILARAERENVDDKIHVFPLCAREDRVQTLFAVPKPKMLIIGVHTATEMEIRKNGKFDLVHRPYSFYFLTITEAALLRAMRRVRRPSFSERSAESSSGKKASTL